MNPISVKQESGSVSPETPVPPPEESAIPVKTKGTYATREMPSANTQSVVQGKEKLIRERTEQVAGRRSDTASAGQTPADSGKTPSPVTEQDAVPVKTKETYAQKVTPAETQSAAQGKQKLVRERAEQVTQRRIENISEQKPASSADTTRNSPPPRSKQKSRMPKGIPCRSLKMSSKAKGNL